MQTTSITIGAVFAFAFLLAVPLGWLFRIQLRPGRYTHLDGLRAIAALMVVCSHYLAHAALITRTAADSRLIEAFGAVGVQIFFCITGFLFTRKALSGPVDMGALIASRIRRIVPLYLAAMSAAIVVAVYIITAAHKATPVHPAEVLRAYLYGFVVSDSVPSVAGMSIAGQAGQMWSLAWEWRFYLFVPFIGALLTRRAWIAGALVIAVAGMIAGQYEGSLPPWSFFIPGMACAMVEGRIKAGVRVQLALMIAGIAAYLAALVVYGPVNGVIQTALCAVAFPCALFGHRALLSVRPLRLLGEVSYSIYMLHLVVVSVFWAYVQDDTRWMLYQTADAKLPLAVAALGALFVLSFATYALIERPFMRHSPSGIKASSPIAEVSALSQ